MRIAAALALAIFSLGMTSAAKKLESPQEWTQFRLTAGNNAVVSGTLRASWHVATNAGFSASPAIAQGRMYIGNNGGRFYAIDPRNGRVLWTYHGKNPFMANPLVSGGLVIAGEGNQRSYPDPRRDRQKEPERLLVGTGESAIVALDAKTGALRWRVPSKGSAMPTGAISHGTLLHHDGAGYVSAIDLKRGVELYARNLHSVASMSALVPTANGRFITTGDHPNAVLAFDGRTGTIVWEHNFAANSSGAGDCPPASDGRYVFCNYLVPANGGPRTEIDRPVTQHMYAVNVDTGAVAWDVPTQTGPLPKYNEASIPLLDGGRLFAGNGCAPWLNAFDPRTGTLVWSKHLLAPVKGGISAKDGVLYFGDVDGHLWAIDERSGFVVGTKDVGAQFNVGSPVIAGKTLIIGSNTGSIIALPLEAIRAARDI